MRDPRNPHPSDPPLSDPVDDLLDRYLAGECSPEEADRAHREAQLRYGRPDILEHVQETLTDYATWKRITAQLSLVTPGDAQSMKPNAPVDITPGGKRTFAPMFAKAHQRRNWMRSLAAGFMLAILGGSGWWVAQHQLRRDAVRLAEREVTETQPGQRATVTLRDGTRVMLGPASRLEYTGAYGVARREVSLVGQAYFEVQHDAEHPFVVRTKDAICEDLGTTFVVRAYPSDSGARVAVREGRVAVNTVRRKPDPSAVLVAGNVAKIDSAHGVVRLPETAEQEFAWTSGALIFRNVPASAIAADLERWFDIEIDIPDTALRARALTVEVHTTAPGEALELLAALLHGRVESHGRFYTILPR
jgi:ferric-dicitrate binding protein FerR (iron transport regulator)